MSKKSNPVVVFAATIAAAATMHGENHNLLQKEVDEGNIDKKRAAQREACHAKVDAQIAALPETVVSVMTEFKLSPEFVESQSREFKLRFRKVCEGLASNTRPKDNAADAAFAYLKSRQEAGQTAFDFGVIQKQMNHQTPTQARNLRTLLVGLNAAEKVKGGFNVNWEAPALVRILSLY